MRVTVSKPSGSGFAVHWTLLLADKLGLLPRRVSRSRSSSRSGRGTRRCSRARCDHAARPDETIALIDRGAEIASLPRLMRVRRFYLYAADDVRSVADFGGADRRISAQFGAARSSCECCSEDEGLGRDDYSIVHTGASVRAIRRKCKLGTAAARVLSPRRIGTREGRLPAAGEFPDGIRILCSLRFRRRTVSPKGTRCDGRASCARNYGPNTSFNDPLRKDECVALLAAGRTASSAPRPLRCLIRWCKTIASTPRRPRSKARALDNLLQTMIRFGEARSTMRPADCFEGRYLAEAASPTQRSNRPHHK